MGKILRDNEGNLFIRDTNFGEPDDTYLGAVFIGDDGFYNWDPQGHGYYSSQLLTLIVNYLNKLNEHHEKNIADFFGKEVSNNDFELDDNGQF